MQVEHLAQVCGFWKVAASKALYTGVSLGRSSPRENFCSVVFSWVKVCPARFRVSACNCSRNYRNRTVLGMSCALSSGCQSPNALEVHDTDTEHGTHVPGTASSIRGKMIVVCGTTSVGESELRTLSKRFRKLDLSSLSSGRSFSVRMRQSCSSLARTCGWLLAVCWGSKRIESSAVSLC
jgi:hypothetical protein